MISLTQLTSCRWMPQNALDQMLIAHCPDGFAVTGFRSLSFSVPTRDRFSPHALLKCYSIDYSAYMHYEYHTSDRKYTMQAACLLFTAELGILYSTIVPYYKYTLMRVSVILGVLMKSPAASSV